MWLLSINLFLTRSKVAIFFQNVLSLFTIDVIINNFAPANQIIVSSCAFSQSKCSAGKLRALIGYSISNRRIKSQISYSFTEVSERSVIKSDTGLLLA